MKALFRGDNERRGKQAEIFNWQVCTDDNEWHTSQQALRAVASTATGLQLRRSWWRWVPVCVGLTLITTIASFGWVQAQIGLAKIKTELQSAVDAELWMSIHSTASQQSHSAADDPASLAKPQGHLLDLVDLDRTEVAISKMEIIELGDKWARLQVEIQNAESSSLYRQTQIYRQTDAGWQRTQPIAPYWGNSQQFESRYFVFHYFAQDEDAVEAAAPKLDALYPNFYGAFFSGPLAVDKLHVQVDPADTVDHTMQHSEDFVSAPLIVPSPSAMLAPAEMPEEELFLQAVAFTLFNYLAGQALDQIECYGWDPPSARVCLHDEYGRWYSLLKAVRLWLIWDQELPLAIWREPLVLWGLGTQDAVLSPRVTTPPYARDICIHHDLWKAMPADTDIPVICNGFGTKKSIVAFHYPFPSRHPLSPGELTKQLTVLEQLDDLREQAGNPTLHFSTVRLQSLEFTVVFATFLEYVASTYGYDKVPLTITALVRHASSNTPLPALYGVSMDELEAGWMKFLMERYGVVP